MFIVGITGQKLKAKRRRMYHTKQVVKDTKLIKIQAFLKQAGMTQNNFETLARDEGTRQLLFYYEKFLAVTKWYVKLLSALAKNEHKDPEKYQKILDTYGKEHLKNTGLKRVSEALVEMKKLSEYLEERLKEVEADNQEELSDLFDDDGDSEEEETVPEQTQVREGVSRMTLSEKRMRKFLATETVAKRKHGKNAIKVAR